MVDQAQIANPKRPPNGRPETPPHAVARSSAEFLSDIATLAELQGKLLLVEFNDGISRLLFSAAIAVAGTVIALGCVPIALAALALTIHTYAQLSLAASFGIALASGLVLAAALLIPALFAVRKGLWIFERSRDEWRKNVQWAKEALRRMGQGNSPPSPPPTLW